MMPIKPVNYSPVVFAIVRSKVMVLVLLLLHGPLCMLWGFFSCFVLFIVLFLYMVSLVFSCGHTVGEDGAGSVYPVSILYKSIAGRYRPVREADEPMTARYRFIKNASWVCCLS